MMIRRASRRARRDTRPKGTRTRRSGPRACSSDACGRTRFCSRRASSVSRSRRSRAAAPPRARGRSTPRRRAAARGGIVRRRRARARAMLGARRARGARADTAFAGVPRTAGGSARARLETPPSAARAPKEKMSTRWRAGGFDARLGRRRFDRVARFRRAAAHHAAGRRAVTRGRHRRRRRKNTRAVAAIDAVSGFERDSPGRKTPRPRRTSGPRCVVYLARSLRYVFVARLKRAPSPALTTMDTLLGSLLAVPRVAPRLRARHCHREVVPHLRRAPHDAALHALHGGGVGGGGGGLGGGATWRRALFLFADLASRAAAFALAGWMRAARPCVSTARAQAPTNRSARRRAPDGAPPPSRWRVRRVRREERLHDGGHAAVADASGERALQRPPQ